MLDNQDNTVIESISSWINSNPNSHANKRPCLTAANSATLFVAIPKFRENLDIQNPKLSHNSPPAPAIPRLPMEVPSVLSVK